MTQNDCILIGYSGHSYVIADAIFSYGGNVLGYCDSEEKKHNPYSLNYLGLENDTLLANQNWIIAIGDNKVRRNIYEEYNHLGKLLIVKHVSAVIGFKVEIGKGTFIAPNTTINAMSTIGNCAVINTGAIIEHECSIGDFSHIAPGSVLAGNVKVGIQSFIGANSVIKQGVSIGDNVIIGAGSVIIQDVPSGVTVVGNPGRIILPK